MWHLDTESDGNTSMAVSERFNINPLPPPVAERRETATTRHGHVDRDPYAWLRDPDWREATRDPSCLSSRIRRHLETENAYTDSVLEPAADLRTLLYEELKARLKQDDGSVPFPDGDYLYYQRYVEGGQHPVYCRRRKGSDVEEILIDGNREAGSSGYFRVARCRHSPDHRLVAFTADRNGSENHELLIRDPETGSDLESVATSAHGDFVWSADSRTVFYTVLDEHHRPNMVLRHRLGEDPENDALVYLEPDPGFFIDLDKTESGRFIVITARDHALTSELRVVPARSPTDDPIVIAAREPGVDYSIGDDGSRVLILTNADGAEDYKIAEAPLETPGRAHWRDVVPHEPGRMIRRLVLFRDFFVRLERVNALPRIVVRSSKSGEEFEIDFDEEAYDLGISRGFEYDTTTLRFTYSSLTTPPRTFDFDMESRERVLRKEQEIPSGHDPADYIAHRFNATGHDGVEIPVSVLRRHDVEADGTPPLLLYGYGSYGMSIPASFSPNRFSLVDRGFIYAVAHVRGGMDRGYRWYRDGKLENKANTFKDFISAAEALIDRKYAVGGRIVAHGGSAGGMLVGAVINMRPDLFGAAVAEVPFVDVLNTMSDDSLPLTPPEWVEWGNPITDAEACRRMRGYSPYDNVTAQDYPPVLATAGVSDPRVTYWEPAKWIARLRALKTDDNPVLLRTNMGAGHGGAAGRFERLDEIALIYAFILRALNRSDMTRGTRP